MITDLITAIVYLALACGVLAISVRLFSGAVAPPPVPSRFERVLLEPFFPAPVVVDLCNHPYEDLPLDSLISHLYAEHFEVWNLLGEKNPPPEKWRGEHKVEHGVKK